MEKSKILEYKKRKMRKSVYNFFRGSTGLFYKNIPDEIVKLHTQYSKKNFVNTWILGDFHPGNIGFFENKNNEIIFDLNDFDEVTIGPFYIDIFRFITSLFIIKDEVDFNLSNKEAKEISNCFITEYFKAYLKTPYELNEFNLKDKVKKKCSKLLKKRTHEKLLDKWTILKNDNRQFKENGKLKRVQGKKILENFNTYLLDIKDFAESLNSSYFNVVDIALRLKSGLGSLGKEKYYLLIQGKSDSKNVILEIKEQAKPNTLNFIKNYGCFFKNEAQRVKTGWLAMLEAPDRHIGVLDTGKKSFTVKKISRYKYKFKPKKFDKKSELESFIEFSAISLAFAHIRASSCIKSNFIDFKKLVIDNFIKDKSLINSLLKNAEYYAEKITSKYNSF